MKIINKSTYGLTILLTRQCNLDCTYCYVHKQTKHDYDDNTLIKRGILFFLYQPGYIKEITFAGGEICLVPIETLRDIFAFLVKMRGIFNKKTISITVVTNGTVYKKEYFELFQEYCDEIRISIDGAPESHNIDRGDGTGEKISDVFMKMITEIPGITKKISINKVISPNNVATIQSDVLFIYENYLSKLSGKGLSMGTAQGVVGWTRRHQLQLQINGMKLMKMIQSSPELLKKTKRLFSVKFGSCLYSNLALGYDGKIYNCDFNANRTDVTGKNAYLYDIVSDSINPKLHINSCSFNLLSEDCKNETCSICLGTCVNFDTKKSGLLDPKDADILKTVKIEGRMWKYVFGTERDYTIKFEGISDARVIKFSNFLFGFCEFLKPKNLNIFITSLTKEEEIFLRKTFANYSLNFIDSKTSNSPIDLILDIENDIILNENRDIIGDMNVGFSYVDLIK